MLFIVLVLAYLFGSIPSAVWVGKLIFKKDVRNYGSKNPGATNTFRVLGAKAGSIVLVLDILKGFLPGLYLPKLLFFSPETNQYQNIQLLIGVILVLGHIFPLFTKFKGGKGIATTLGILLAIMPSAAIFCIGIFIVTFLLGGYVSLGSVLAGLSFPISILFIFISENPLIALFSVLFCIVVLITHRKNILRLLHSDENKVNFRGKKLYKLKE